MQLRISMIIYVILQLVAFFFVLVGTPIDMFRVQKHPPTPLPRLCITLWGLKEDCGNTSYTMGVSELWMFCPDRRDRFRAAQAFAVISIFVYGAAFVLGVLMLCFHLLLRWVCLGLNVAGVVTLCIVWASMVVTYYKNDDPGCPATSRLYNYAAGFILFLVAWCLDIINIGLLLLPLADTLFLGSAKKEPSTGPEEEEVK